MVKYVEEKEDEWEVAAESGQSDIHMHTSTRECINSLSVDVDEVDGDLHPATNNKAINIVNTDQPVYKDVWVFNGIDHTRASDC